MPQINLTATSNHYLAVPQQRTIQQAQPCHNYYESSQVVQATLKYLHENIGKVASEEVHALAGEIKSLVRDNDYKETLLKVQQRVASSVQLHEQRMLNKIDGIDIFMCSATAACALATGALTYYKFIEFRNASDWLSDKALNAANISLLSGCAALMSSVVFGVWVSETFFPNQEVHKKKYEHFMLISQELETILSAL